MKVCVFEDEGLTADHHLITAIGHNMRPSHAIDKSCMVAAIDAKLQDKDSDLIPPKQQRTPQMRKAVPKHKRNEAANEESDPNDDDFATSGEGSEDSTSDEDSVIISNVEVCSNVLSQHACL